MKWDRSPHWRIAKAALTKKGIRLSAKECLELLKEPDIWQGASMDDEVLADEIEAHLFKKTTQRSPEWSGGANCWGTIQ